MIKKIKNLITKNKQIILYLVFGGLTTLINIISYFLCTKIFNINWQISNIVAWVLAVLFAYVTNKFLVFESKNKKVFKEVIYFFVFRLISLIMDMGFMYLFLDLINLNDMISKLIVQLLIIIINYIFSKFIIFKK